MFQKITVEPTTVWEGSIKQKEIINNYAEERPPSWEEVDGAIKQDHWGGFTDSEEWSVSLAWRLL